METDGSVLCLQESATALTNMNHDEIRRSVNYGSAFYCHSVRNLFSSRLPSKTLKIKTHKAIILPLALYGSEKLYLNL
jgi:hypothetical protein